MSNEYWREVSKDYVGNGHVVYTYEHTVPHGVLVMVVSVNSHSRTVTMQFVPNPSIHRTGEYR